MANKKEVSVDLKLYQIQDDIKQLKDGTKKVVRKVVFKGKDNESIKVDFKADKNDHPLKDWSNDMFDEQEDMVMLLELPKIRQAKITEFDDLEED